MLYKTRKGKEKNATELQRNNYPKNSKLQENIIYLEFSYKTKAMLNSIIFKKNIII